MTACRHVDQVAYLSQMTAGNAVELHQLANPACAGGINAFECGDHWHIGHADHDGGVECRTASSVALEERYARRAPRRR